MTQTLLNSLKRARYALALLCLLCTPHLYAQQSLIVTGVVKDDGGVALPGANIVVKGTTTGTVTDGEGKYSIAAPDAESVLIFSFIGYKSQEVTIGQQTTIDITLAADISTLAEVVVVGYGTQEKVNMTGAVSAVKFDEKITSRALSNVSSGLAGLVPGLTATQSRGMAGNNSAQLLIRGLGSVNNSGPLIVVDNVPDIDINLINYNDIESISVLKDAASAAIYGSRGANGVVLVTTKSGKGLKKTSITYNGSYGISHPTRSPKFLADYARALTLEDQTAATNTVPASLPFKYGTIDQWMAMGMVDPLRFPNTNWWDVILRTGSVSNHSLSMTGGNDRSNFFISAGIMKEKGLQINNDYTRSNIRFSYDYKLNKNMNTGMKVAGNWSDNTFSLPEGFSQNVADNTAGEDMQYAIAGITPFDPVSGNFGGAMAYGENVQAYNPYTQYVNRLNHQNRQEVYPQIYFDWTPIKGLTAGAVYNMNYYNQFTWNADTPNQAYNFQTNSLGSRVYVASNAGITNTTNTGFKTQLNGRLNYTTKIAKNHDLSGLFIYSEEYWNDRTQSATRLDRLYSALHELDAAIGTQSVSGNSSTEGLRSYIGRINYSAFGKYLFEITARYDGSSKFLPGHQYGFFPAVSAGWRFKEESFMSNVNWLANGKLRASYGSLGNISGVGRTQQQSTLQAGHYMTDPSTIAKGLVNSKLLNLDLTWEATKVLDIGLELGFLNNRLTAEFDYYDRLTTGMLLPTSLSILLSGGYSAPQQNIGNLRNRGVELTLGWRDMIGDKISYSIRANGSYNTNYIEQWSGYLGRGATPNGNYTFLNMPYNYVYTYADKGIAQSWQDVYNATPQSASPGDVLRQDVNGDGRIDENDRKALPGVSRDRPNFNYGITGSISYKGFDFQILLQGATGRRDFWLNIYNTVNPVTTRYAFSPDHWTNPWSLDNRDGAWPRLGGNANSTANGPNPTQTTFWLDKLDYMRVKNIQLGYRIPATVLNRIKMSSCRIYASADNLFTFTKYRGLDPEKTSASRDVYPLVQSISFGASITY
ncbi:SusC/RagA family TonB-linked outer membrane protein [Cytophagales bacterium WSM2-2]|nr:SusC/RagA family TonB-linked outer membrane protein [Cytophagales bacterium WSM2-2]